MDLKNLLNSVNYDDFYKFSVSLSIIGFLLSLIFATIIVAYGGLSKWFYSVSFFEYVIIAVIFLSFAVWAGKKWLGNQKKLDQLLDLEVKLKVAEYEKAINELSKNESIFPDPLSHIQRTKAVKKIDNHLESNT